MRAAAAGPLPPSADRPPTLPAPCRLAAGTGPLSGFHLLVPAADRTLPSPAPFGGGSAVPRPLPDLPAGP